MKRKKNCTKMSHFVDISHILEKDWTIRTQSQARQSVANWLTVTRGQTLFALQTTCKH